MRVLLQGVLAAVSFHRSSRTLSCSPEEARFRMHLSLLVSLSIALSILTRSTLQVSVSLYSGATHPYSSFTCLKLLPGQCCLAPGHGWVLRNAQVVTFDHLAPYHIAAVWSPRWQVDRTPTYIGGCSGIVIASRNGPGTWTWRGSRAPAIEEGTVYRADTGATGASYIEMPQGLPPDSRMSNWLAAEGILGLVWGGGHWFVSPSAAKLLSGEGGVIPTSQSRRDIRSKKEGAVYAMSPRRSIHPTFITVNGTKYTGSDAGALVYRSDAGDVLDLAKLEP